MKHRFLPIFALASLLIFTSSLIAQRSGKKKQISETSAETLFSADHFAGLKWRNIGPFRGGRAVAGSGVPGNSQAYYFGSVGGGLWKTTDAGLNWSNISDGFFNSASVGAIAVSSSDPNILYVGMGEHSIRGVMSSQGDGVYKSTDAGKTWKNVGLKKSRTIAAIRIHPDNPEHIYVAVQGTQWSDSEDRGVYRSMDGGQSWERILYVDQQTGAADLSMDPTNPRILYAGMWDHRRDPWRIRSGGEGSGLYKSTDGGDNWEKINKGLPELMGKVAVDVSPANPERLYANIEAEGSRGGVYRSDDSGKSWKQVSKDKATIGRAWYYTEIVADPLDPETVYVINKPLLRSIDGGRTFSSIPVPHVDQHHLWINPADPLNMILSNDGGACISFNGGKSWSSQNNQPTAQFYRVITDDQFPYHIYGGQQDNSTVAITSKTIAGGIGIRDWHTVAGGESAFLAFNNPANPVFTYGTSIQGFITAHNKKTGMQKDIMAHPAVNLGSTPINQKYRFNWNGPLVHKQLNPAILYHGSNKLLRSDNGGFSWTEISPDLTRNDSTKHTITGVPFTNEAAGGEVYNTISYIASSPHEEKVIWVGTDDGLVHVTKNEGRNWTEVSPPVEGESLINAIELSPHDKATAYLAVNRYKFDDTRPMIFVTRDYGATWKSIVHGLPQDHFVRVVREDPVRQGLLYAGTENGLHISFNGGASWHPFQSNLPVTPVTDLTIKDNDLVAATSGRAFWVLDDLSALQQSMGNPDTTRLQLYSPKTTYRFTLGGGFEKGNTGQNPWPGVIIDYYLPHQLSDSSTLSLEILDEDGKVIRTYSNKKASDYKSWPGAPPPPQILPAKPGLNRTYWDLGREILPGMEGVFVMNSLAGSIVGPGSYSLRMKLEMSDGTQTSGQEVRVKADPRLEVTEADWALQQEMLIDMETAIREIHESVNRLRKVKAQLNNRLELLDTLEGSDELQKKGKEVLSSIENWEEQLIQPRQKDPQDVIQFEHRLSSELNNLRNRVNSYDPRPTRGAMERLEELYGQWEKWEQEMDRIIQSEVGAFNELYAELDYPALIVPALDY